MTEAGKTCRILFSFSFRSACAANMWSTCSIGWCGSVGRQNTCLPITAANLPVLVDLWAYHHGVRIDFSRPGKPTDNAYIETFNGSLRDECLNVHWFETIGQARQLIEAWWSAL